MAWGLIVKVLVGDTFEQVGLDGLAAAGCDVVYQPGLKDDGLRQAVRTTGAEVLIVRGTRVTAETLESGSLSLVVRAGAGYNTIDVGAASARGIFVSNCPGKNAIAVAELAFGLMLALDRRIPDNVARLRAGTWSKQEFSTARGLFGRCLGLLGYGSIGQEMARRALAFGMRTVVWSRRFAAAGLGHPPEPGIELASSPQEVAAKADVLSVHLALAPETRGLIDRTVFEQLRPGSMFINTARAEIVDQGALEEATRDRGLRVGLDVFANEPASGTGEIAEPLAALPNVYGTHHIGASTEQAQEAIALEAVRIVAAYKTTGKVPNVVNLASRTPATHTLIVRHRDRPGVLAHVFDRLRAGDINVQETENIVFAGAEAAVARINLDRKPSDAILRDVREGNADIIDLRLVAI